MTEQEEMKNEFVNGKQVKITAIDMVIFPATSDIKQIRFNSDIGVITWKPKVEVVAYIEGMKTITPQVMTIKDLPQQLKDAGNFIASNGEVSAIIDYTLMTKEVDGQTQEYRYITSIKTFEKWDFLIDPEKEEKVKNKKE